MENASYCSCSLPNAMRSNNSLSHSHQQMMPVYTKLPYCCGNYTKNARKRSKSPANSCKCDQSSSRQNWATTLSSSATFPRASDSRSENNKKQVVLKSSINNVEKTNSCPNRTCSCISRLSCKPSKRCSVKSYSTVQVSNNSLNNSQIAQHLVLTGEIVSGLKDEIEKVKHQIHHISHPKPESPKESGRSDIENNLTKTIAQLKLENQRLKRDLEQKKRKQQESLKEVERARDIMNDYEKKVGLLHQQALKSSKVMKQSKERFCKCLEEKESLITELQKNNNDLCRCIAEKDMEYKELNETYDHLQRICEQNNKKCGMLSENNQKFCECIELLENQLKNSLSESERYKDEIQKLEKHLATAKNCTMCQKLDAKAKKQKEKFETRLKEYEENEKILKMQVSEMTSKLNDLPGPDKMQELQDKLEDYEKLASRCKQLEEECQQHCDTIRENETRFAKEREDLRHLVDELTTVVKQNKITLLQLSNINKEQEALLETQSVVLSEKDGRIKLAESSIEMMKSRSFELERQVEDLRNSTTGPCNREACFNISRQLDETLAVLNREKDNQLVKQKIIEDQSQTICNLQVQIKDKISELMRAREQTNNAQDEINKINNELMMKQNELEQELVEKDHLLKKLKKLEGQKSQLSYEMAELEKVLQNYHRSCRCDEKQQAAIADLQSKIQQQRREWEMHKENLYAEKEKAIAAAKFATQKLLDTVADFQSQVNTQRKVQNMLTKMLHEKEEELKSIKSKMISINSLTSGTETELPMNEIFKRKNAFDVSNAGTSSSFYSFCSNCSRYTLKSPNQDKTDLKQLFSMLTRTDEVPIKDS